MVQTHSIFETLRTPSEAGREKERPDDPLEAFIKGVKEFRDLWKQEAKREAHI